jgi:hypothetical protein
MSDTTDFFDEIIDERTVEKISKEYPVLSEEEKERIFSLVERKLNIDNAVNNDHSEEVSGVEKYERHRWISIISVAASAAVLFGGIGSSLCLMHNMKNGVIDDNVPNVVNESVNSPTSPSLTAAEKNIAAESKENRPVQKSTAAAEDHIVKAAENVKEDTLISSAVVNVSLENDEMAAEQGALPADMAYTADTESNESQEITETNIPVTTALVTIPQETTQTTIARGSDENRGLLEAAENLIDEYDGIMNIVDMNVPVIDNSTITVIHQLTTPSGDGVYNRLLEYGQVDPDVYPDMQTMKEQFLSVMCSSITADDIFGSEFTTGFCSEDIILDKGYSYITYDGKLYRRIGNEKDELEPLNDEAAVIYNITEYAFTAEKNYKDLDDGTIVTLRFGIVRDYKANKWSILTVGQD